VTTVMKLLVVYKAGSFFTSCPRDAEPVSDLPQFRSCVGYVLRAGRSSLVRAGGCKECYVFPGERTPT
jgi:hypothetical protein